MYLNTKRIFGCAVNDFSALILELITTSVFTFYAFLELLWLIQTIRIFVHFIIHTIRTLNFIFVSALCLKNPLIVFMH